MTTQELEVLRRKKCMFSLWFASMCRLVTSGVWRGGLVQAHAPGDVSLVFGFTVMKP